MKKNNYIIYMIIINLAYFFSSIGFIRAISIRIGKRIIDSTDIVPFEYMTEGHFLVEKPQELVFFICGNIWFFFLVTFIIININTHYKIICSFIQTVNRSHLIYYSLYSIFPCLFCIFSHRLNLFLVVIIIFLWSCGIAWPYFVFFRKKVEEVCALILCKKVISLLLVLCVMQFIWILKPFLFDELKIINEFLNIPEITILVDQNGNRKYVDNINFMNENLLFGYVKKYDLRDDATGEKYSDALTILLPENAIRFLKQSKFSRKVEYNEINKKLLIIEPIDSLELEPIRFFVDLNIFDKIMQYNQKAALLQNTINKPKSGYDYETKKFIKLNEFEVIQQTSDRWFIHHHNFILNPVQELALGKETSKIYSQYGWLLIVSLKNWFDNFGIISYQDYVKIWYFGYLLYFFCALIIVKYIFKDNFFVLLYALIVISAIEFDGFIWLHTPPGFNPIRHFGDLFVFGTLFAFLTKEKLRWLLLCWICIGVQMLIDWHFGILLLVGIILAIIIKIYSNRNQYKLNLISAFLSLGCAIFSIFIIQFARFGSDNFALYHLLGISTTQISNYIIYSLIGFYAVIWVIILPQNFMTNSWRIYNIFTWFYSCTIILYFLKAGESWHFFHMSWIHGFAVLALVKGIMQSNLCIQKNYKIIMSSLMIVIIFLYSLTTLKYIYSKNEFDNIFNTHITYTWNFEKARLVSTMNPNYFEESVELIKRYTDRNGIFILSKYDLILPFLANRYSEMPYSDLSRFLITPKDIEVAANIITKHQPDILFVDTDIDRLRYMDIINSKSGFLPDRNSESYWRVKRHTLLQDVFQQVRADYVKLHQGFLITVYKRKS